MTQDTTPPSTSPSPSSSKARPALAGAALLVVGLVAGFATGRLTGSDDTGSDTTVGVDADGYYLGIARAWAGDLSYRTYPSRLGYFKGTNQYGDTMRIECAVTGSEVTWNDLSSDIWYKLDNGMYTTAVYTDLVGAEPVPTCDEALPAEPSDEPRETSYAEVRTAGDDYPIMPTASPDGEPERMIPNLSAVTLLCYEYGDTTDGFFEPTDLWYQIEGGGYAEDGSLITGGSGTAIVFPCE